MLLPPGLTRALKTRGVTGDELLHDPEWQFALTWFAKSVRGNIADVEWQHSRARHHKDPDGKTRWDTFAASQVNREATRVHEEVLQRVMLPQRQPQAPQTLTTALPTPDSEISDASARKRLRASTPLQLFRWDRMSQTKALCGPWQSMTGPSVTGCSSRTWKLVPDLGKFSCL